VRLKHNQSEPGIGQPQFPLDRKQIERIQQNSSRNPAGSVYGSDSILNIRTAQDINIYNNSFIVNTGSSAPHKQRVQPAVVRKTVKLKNDPHQHYLRCLSQQRNSTHPEP